MSDLNALLRAIILNPDEDTPRLAYADELDANGATSVACWHCGGDPVRVFDELPLGTGWEHGPNYSVLHNQSSFPRTYTCRECRGAGSFLDTTNRDRAEFIRVQVELARLSEPDRVPVHSGPATVCGACRMLLDTCPYHQLLNRQRDLSAHRCRTWFPNPTGAEWKWLLPNEEWERSGYCRFDRGFVRALKIPAHEFLKVADQLIWSDKQTVTCDACEGAGWIRWATGHGNYDEAPCSKCGENGVLPRPCPDTAQPIRKVFLTSHATKEYWEHGTLAKTLNVKWPGVAFEFSIHGTEAVSDDSDLFDDAEPEQAPPAPMSDGWNGRAGNGRPGDGVGS